MRDTIILNEPIIITASASVGGEKEAQSPLKMDFDKMFSDNYFGEKTWEKAEVALQKYTIKTLLEKRGIEEKDVDFAIGADLCNQITSTNFTFRDYNIPFFGVYGACSSMSQSLVMASLLLDSKHFNNCLAIVSSHFATAERQFRTPLDYGGKRTPTAQWTVTASGAVFLEKEGKGARITKCHIGTITDLGIKDPNNMGAAMAPSAAKTIIDFLKNTNSKPRDYDVIFTGDLGKIGSSLLKELLKKEGILLDNHMDCGCLIYDFSMENIQSGASGCGCSASVLASYILPRLNSGEYKKILFVATGALLSATTSMQKESIPCIAHLVEITSAKG